MATRPAANPIRRFKDHHGLTYPELSERLGISEDYARKLGCDDVTSVSPAMAVEIERRTAGQITAAAIAKWSHYRVTNPKAKRKRGAAADASRRIA